jgi:SAM-dependent methyltransferase
MYAADPDPWRFATSAYERDKYTATLAALPRRRFVSALEVGCSIGVFTRELARRCDRLLAVDVAEAALAHARATCADGHVVFKNARVPQEWPPGRFDLVVLSEVLYYLDAVDIARVGSLARATLLDDGVIVLVHYLGDTDYPMTGDGAADAFVAAAGLPVTLRVRADQYRLDRLERTAPVNHP